MLLVRCHSGAIEKLWRSSCCKPLQAALVTTGLRARRASTPGTRPMSDWAHGAGDVVRSRLICEFQCARREPCGGNLAYAVRANTRNQFNTGWYRLQFWDGR